MHILVMLTMCNVHGRDCDYIKLRVCVCVCMDYEGSLQTAIGAKNTGTSA